MDTTSTTVTSAASPYRAPAALRLVIAAALVGLVSMISLLIGSSGVPASALLTDPDGWFVLVQSRLPRTASLLLAGIGMSVAGMVMQTITRNKFVEPATAGTLQFAALGMLLVTILAPQTPTWAAAAVAAAAAFIGSVVFLMLVNRVSMTNALVVPLTGIMLGAVVGAAVQYIAIQANLTQMLVAWETGSFTSVIQGRYELLWIALGGALLVLLIADRLSLVNLGEEIAESLGGRYRTTVMIGLLIASVITGAVVAVIGYLPFLGLIMPNVVSLAVGDDVRRSMPLVCLYGGGCVVLCDVIGRVIRPPFEISAGTILGTAGAAVFIVLILRRTRGG